MRVFRQNVGLLLISCQHGSYEDVPVIRVRFWLLYCAAWVPYAASYFVLFRFMSSSNRIALVQTMINIFPAVLLGAGVLRWSRLFPWSRHSRKWFFPLQLASAFTYSLLWYFGVILIGSLVLAARNHRFVLGHFDSHAVQWQFFSGFMVYGSIIGFAYVSQMSTILRNEELRRERAETLQTRVELAALRAQLNPHFLFNTLNSLVALNSQNKDRATEALLQLAQMLRYTLNEHRSEADDDVSLREELAFTDQYLALEALRLGDRLQVERSIDPEALMCRLPALTIQPLIENAIRHGIAPRAGPGKILLVASKRGNSLALYVSDNGVGANPDTVMASNGIGIRTVRQRLALYSGNRGSFEIDGGPGRGLTIYIVLPGEFPGGDREPVTAYEQQEAR